MSFSKVSQVSTNNRAIHCVTGTPNCSAFYNWALTKLQDILSRWHLAYTGPMTPGLQGNLGEFLSYHVARQSGLSGPGFTGIALGANSPLNIGAPTGLDATIVFLSPDGDTSKDRLYVMEMKTTIVQNLSYANALVGDCAKLLDATRPSTNLANRMSGLKGFLSDTLGFSDKLLDRVEDLYRPTAAECVKVKLMPTLVHDLRYGNPVVTLDGVARRIELLGWLPTSVEPWSVSLTRLDECLQHLRRQAAFVP